jgi:hypothetical protein
MVDAELLAGIAAAEKQSSCTRSIGIPGAAVPPGASSDTAAVGILLHHVPQLLLTKQYMSAACAIIQVVNGPDHPGAVGAPPAKYTPPAPAVPEDLAGQQLHGWREVYLREGPEGWAKAVRAHPGLLLTDTTM